MRIYFEQFLLEENTIIIGVENGENFRWIQKQQHLFPGLHPLFVSRYPQSGDLIAWLRSIPNRYLHFGDFDFEGINIYLSEYKKHLGERARFFVPEGIEEMIKKKGNRDLYNKQSPLQPGASLLTEKPVIELLRHIHRHKKVLEQEYLIVA